MKYYVTTPIYYINDVPTVGNAYTTIIADVLARWERLRGKNVFFLTGLDENSIKTVQAAKEKGFKDVQKYADSMAAKWEGVWKKLGISYDGFIRTTEERHAKVVGEIFDKVNKKGDIYKGEYKGLYCNGCETFLTEAELVDGKCANHKKAPEKISEENYFFALSKYQNRLLEHIEKNPGFIQPKSRRNEVLSFLKEGLRDVSISRPGLEWGIPLPIDNKHRYWVWFDALSNYISGAKDFWPADLHLVGKDLIRFHCLIWPAMLMSAGYKLPKTIFAHGFFTINGEKMSKSLGNAIDPLHIVGKYSNDALRYFLLREIPFGEDGDFSEQALKQRINGELVSDLGNLVSRVLALAEKCKDDFKGKKELDKKLDLKKIEKLMDSFELHHALDEVFRFIRANNAYINQKEPWKLKGSQLGEVLYNLLEGLRVIAILVSPFLPESAEEINRQLGVKPGLLKDTGFREWKGKPRKGKHLFQKVE